ncbi:MAG: imelysin family protein, partial [Alphaproteobacteria bacterium]
LVALRKAYHEGVDSWQAIQHVRFGPVEYLSRAQRFAFWPDNRNAVGRAIGELLAARDPTALAPSAFAKGNVAIQGFPAMERLLFDADAPARIGAADADGGFRCAFLLAIAGNLATMAREVVDGWTRGEDAYARAIAGAGPDGAIYRHPKEATLDLIKSLHLSVEIVADHKLARPLGASLQAARPRLAESWRSERSLANVRIDLQAGAAMIDTAGGFADATVAAGDAPLADLLRRAFAQTLSTARGIAGTLEAAVADKRRRPAVERLRTETAALKALIARRLTAALDVPIGFNALDGD